MTTSREADHPFEAVVRHLQDRLYPQGEPQETTPVQVQTYEEVAQFFADEFQEPSLKSHLVSYIEEIERMKDVYGLGILALYGTHLSLRLIAERESTHYVQPSQRAYDRFYLDFLGSSPEERANRRVGLHTNFYLVEGASSLETVLPEIQNEVRKEEGVSAMAFVTFAKPA